MEQTVKVAMAQLDLAVGDVVGNTRKIIEYSVRARDELRADHDRQLGVAKSVSAISSSKYSSMPVVWRLDLARLRLRRRSPHRWPGKTKT